MTTSPLTVVLGAGPVGTGTALRLARRGHQVRVVTRSGTGPRHPDVTLVRADASDPAAMLAATVGATAVVNAVNPPYTRWPSDWPPVHTAVRAAAEAHDAVLVLVDNLYAYGPVHGPMTEDLPLAATGSKGRTRAWMEQDLLDAHRAGRLRVAVAKSSDYVGPGVVDAALGERVMPRLLAGRSVQVLGDPDAPHSWTSVDDVAAAVATMVDDPRAWGRSWHVPTAPAVSARQALEQMAAAAGMAAPRVRSVSRVTIGALGVVAPVLRELRETFHQFDRPFVVDSSAFTSTFGTPPTPWPDTVAATVAWWQARADADVSRSAR